MASFNILNHLAYAFSALSQAAQKVAGHDFVMIWRGGVHPCISMIAIIALPIMTKVGMYVMEKHPPIYN